MTLCRIDCCITCFVGEQTAPSAEELGYADNVYTDEFGDTSVVIFRQDEKESRIATLIIRGATDNFLDDIERAIDDGVNNFKSLARVCLIKLGSTFHLFNIIFILLILIDKERSKILSISS